jgi:adenosine deaminase
VHVDSLVPRGREALQRRCADRRSRLGECHREGVVRPPRPLRGLRVAIGRRLHRGRVVAERRSGDVGRGIEEVTADPHPVPQQRGPLLPGVEEREGGVGVAEAVERGRRIVAIESPEPRGEGVHDGLGGMPPLHEEGGRVGARSQLGGNELEVGSSIREEGNGKPGSDSSCESGQCQQRPPGCISLVAGAGENVGRRHQLGSGSLARDRQRRATSRVLARTVELRAEAAEVGRCGVGDVGDQLHPGRRPGRIGTCRVSCAQAEADPDRQPNDDGDHRSAPATGTYHLPVDLDRIRILPKAELHLHLDGSLRPQTAVELAAEAGQTLTLADAAARLVGPIRCADQAELLTFFDLPISLLQTAAALRRVTAELVESLADDGLTYAEIRWAPRLHLEQGMSVLDVIGAVADGVAEAASRLGPRTPFIGLIATAMRSHPPAANVELAKAAAAFGPPLVGFDLAGPEAAYPAPPHAAAFLAAAEGGLVLTAHAGEVPGPERIREALAFGVRRIAHGVTAAHDPEVMALLRERDVTLDLCPTSNVQSGIVSDLAAHPLAAMHRAGVSVTISTDDRTVSNTTLTEEMARTAAALRLAAGELAEIAVNAFRRAFGPGSVLDPMRRAAEQAWSTWAAGVPDIS